MGMIGRGGDRQDLAERLDPMEPTMIVDEGDHGLNRRSSSAWAKYADALRRIWFACRSSRFSRSRALSRTPCLSSDQACGPRRAPPVSPTRSASGPCSRSWPRSRGSSHSATGAAPRDLAHPHRPLAHLRRKFACRLARHRSSLSGVGASDKPGAVQPPMEIGLSSAIPGAADGVRNGLLKAAGGQQHPVLPQLKPRVGRQ
jgi:hypothetical protein